MAWRVEWTGGTTDGLAPVGWRRFDLFNDVRAFALEVLRSDPRLDLRIVLVGCFEGAEVDMEAVAPSVATLTTWSAATALPDHCRNAGAARSASREATRSEAMESLRAVLDHLLESGGISRVEAARVFATLAAAMIRSASAAAA